MKDPITVSTIINLPASDVWAKWIGPEHITEWCAASDDWHAPAATNDVRVGGRFSTTMAARDGSAQFEFGGEYTDVVEHALLAYAMDDGRTVRVEFEDKGDKTLVTETFDPEQENPRNMQAAGWQAILDNFKKYAEHGH